MEPATGGLPCSVDKQRSLVFKKGGGFGRDRGRFCLHLKSPSRSCVRHRVVPLSTGSAGREAGAAAWSQSACRRREQRRETPPPRDNGATSVSPDKLPPTNGMAGTLPSRKGGMGIWWENGISHAGLPGLSPSPHLEFADPLWKAARAVTPRVLPALASSLGLSRTAWDGKDGLGEGREGGRVCSRCVPQILLLAWDTLWRRSEALTAAFPPRTNFPWNLPPLGDTRGGKRPSCDGLWRALVAGRFSRICPWDSLPL